MGSYHTAMQPYLALTLRTPRFEHTVIPAHDAFLDDLKAQGTLAGSGPFTDKSDGGSPGSNQRPERLTPSQLPAARHEPSVNERPMTAHGTLQTCHVAAKRERRFIKPGFPQPDAADPRTPRQRRWRQGMADATVIF